MSYKSKLCHKIINMQIAYENKVRKWFQYWRISVGSNLLR